MSLLRPLLVSSLASLATAAEPLPLVHPLFADHAVLQCHQPLPIWGWTTPGATVTVRLGTVTGSGVAGADGRWQVVLPPQEAGPARDLVISGPHDQIIHDILLGEVWLCSGQSNMQWALQRAADGPATVAASADPDLRLFQVGNAIAVRPELVPQRSAWSVSSPASSATFSAVGWYFGRELRQRLGVPIGLIHASWGGTPLESWVAAPTLATLPSRRGSIARFEADLAARDHDFRGDNDAQRAAWWASFDPDSAGTPAAGADPQRDDTAWATVPLMPNNIGGHGVAAPGVVWYRTVIDLPAEVRGQALTLDLPAIGGEDRTWINGEVAGDSFIGWNERHYPVTAAQTGTGRLVIAVRVFTSALSGGFQAGNLALRHGAQVVADLRHGWRWKAGPAYRADHQPPLRLGSSPFVPSVLFNGMIHPLQPSALAGVLWYQGEANTSGHATYQAGLTALITSWRTGFGRDLPVGIVQLANYGPRHEQPADSAWASLRAAQAATVQAVPGTGLAVTMDIGTGKDIHPTNKREVGRRLSLWALHDVYGQHDTVYSGPRFTRHTVEGSHLRLSFEASDGLRPSSGTALTGFAIAGADGRYHWATAEIDQETIVVSAPEVPAPVHVRYAWDDDPAGNLTNAAGLPAIPFQSSP